MLQKTAFRSAGPTPLEKVRAQIKAATPPAADFVLGTDGSRTVFPVGTVTGILFRRQVGTASFVSTPVPTAALAGPHSWRRATAGSTRDARRAGR